MVARGWSRLLTALACGVGGALLWAYALTVVQPATEPAPGVWAENNTYWARDVRWMAIVAVVCALVLAVRGVRTPTLVAVGAGVAWALADVWLLQAALAGSCSPAWSRRPRTGPPVFRCPRWSSAWSPSSRGQPWS